MGSLSFAEILDSLPENYLLDNVLGQGGFGQVVKCVLKDTNQAVAVKLPLDKQDTKEEIALLQELMEERMDQRNIVRFIDSFDTSLGRAMVFELLDMSLYGLLEKYDPLPLSDIVSIVGQVATALDVLKERSLVHSDLKMDNVMVVDHSPRPLHVKLIDFGLTMPVSETVTLFSIHHVKYRPPEVILDSGWDEGLDVWCLGVIMSHLWLRFNLFPNMEYEALRVMHKLLRPPPEHILNEGINTTNFYRRIRTGWKLRIRKDMEASLHYGLREDHYSESFASLKDMITDIVAEDEVNTDPALDLLTKMLDMDMNNRITPKQILQHPAIYFEQKEASDESANSAHSEEEHMPLSCLKIEGILPEEYKVIKTLAVGKFSRFVKCKNTSINQFVTIKVSLSNKRAQREVRLLHEISLAGMDRKNIVKFLDSIQTSHGTVVVLEYLEMSLSAYIDKSYPLPLANIRTIVNQTAIALKALQCKKLIHTGVTAENIFVCSLSEQSPKIKLADFGSVIQTNKAKAGMTVQPLAFRAPEVILGLPFKQSIDIWSLGCTLVQMITRIPLFSNDSEFKNMETMVRFLGTPSSLDLNKGLKTREFFKRVGGAWALKTLEEFEDFPNFRSALAHLYFERCPSETELLPHYMKYPKELTKCLDLAKKMLHLKEIDRITADEIMEHPFILWKTKNDKPKPGPVKEVRMATSKVMLKPVEPENTGDSKTMMSREKARKTFDVIQPKDSMSAEKSTQRDPVQEQQQSGSPLNMETKAEDREPALIQPPTSTSCDKADEQLKDRPKRKRWRMRTAKVQPMSDSTLPPTEDDFVPKKKTKNIFRRAFSWLKRCSCF